MIPGGRQFQAQESARTKSLRQMCAGRVLFWFGFLETDKDASVARTQLTRGNAEGSEIREKARSWRAI